MSEQANKIRGWMPALLASVGVLVLLVGFVPYNIGYAQAIVPMWRDLWLLWHGYEDWQHCMFVPFISLALVYFKRARLARIPVQGEVWALVPMIFALFMYWAGFRADVRYAGHLGIQLFIGSLVVWFLGWRMFKAVMFPWAFLIFTWPFLFLDNMVAFPLRMVMSDVSFQFLNLIGLDTVREGTAIVSAPDFAKGIEKGAKFAVDIADPCSGIRSLFALMMVACIYAYVFLKTPMQRWVLFLSSMPLAILGNFARIMMLTFGTMAFGSEFAIGPVGHPSGFHFIAGIAVFAVALAGMVAIGELLKRLPARFNNLLGRGDAEEEAT